MPINLDNAQFNQFLLFAQQQKNDKAIARVAHGDGEHSLEGRTIVAAKHDKVAPFGKRRADEKRANDLTRDLFCVTVAKMFGGARNIPPSVLDAMKPEDYDKGKPLTAHRIISVHKAIVEAAEPINARVSTKKANTLVNEAIRYVNHQTDMAKSLGNAYAPKLNLNAKQIEKASRLIMTHGGGMTDRCQRILANFVVVSIASKVYNDEELDVIACDVGQSLQKVRNFKPGDPRLSKLDASLTKYWQSTLKDNLSKNLTKKYDENGLYQSFREDSKRANYTICGQTFRVGDKKSGDVTEKMKQEIPNLLHRKAISSFLNQQIGIYTGSLHTRTALPPTTKYTNLNVKSVKGFDMLMSIDQDAPVFNECGNLQNPSSVNISLDINKERTKATATIRTGGEIKFRLTKADKTEWSVADMCTYSYETVFEFDISDPNRIKLTNAHLGQTLNVQEPPEQEEPQEQEQIEEMQVPKFGDD